MDDFSADDFEFVDPEYSHLQAAGKAYALSSAAGQNELLSELARNAGVQTVVLSSLQGQVISERTPPGAAPLGSVVAATAMLLRGRGLRLLSAQFAGATVCMRVVGDYCVAVVARGNVNIGRLLSELRQIQIEATP